MRGIELIGISGKSKAGKDHLGKHILRPRGFMPYALAWPLKTQLVGRRFLLHSEAFAAEKSLTTRALLQGGGTENARDVYGEDIWIDTADSWLHILHDEYGFDKIYVPDIRFWNEAQWVHDHGGKLIRIVGGGLEDEELASHRSETELDEWEEWDAIVHSHSATHVLESSLREQGIIE